MSWSIKFKPETVFKTLRGNFYVYYNDKLIMDKLILGIRRYCDKPEALIFGNSLVPVTYKEIKDFIDSINNDICAKLCLDITDFGNDVIKYENKRLTFSIVLESLNNMDFILHINTPEFKTQVITAFETFLEFCSDPYREGY